MRLNIYPKAYDNRLSPTDPVYEKLVKGLLLATGRNFALL